LDRRELLSAMQIIDLLKRRFDEEHITVVGDERGLETIRLMPRSHFVQIRAADLNGFFHPRHDFLSRLKGIPFDLAIDLNLDLLLPSAYICRASNAKVRIGFKGPRSDSFYNFQIQPDPSQSRKGIYDRVAKCLQMF
jgi:ADP-heptose:LPS heptosyltransferase